MSKRTLKDQREIALGTARSKLRELKALDSATFKDVLTVLDEMLSSSPDIIAAQWYRDASDNQINLLKRDWNTWKQGVRNL